MHKARQMSTKSKRTNQPTTERKIEKTTYNTESNLMFWLREKLNHKIFHHFDEKATILVSMRIEAISIPKKGNYLWGNGERLCEKKIEIDGCQE